MNSDYLDGMKHCFGTMLDYTVNCCGIDGDRFLDMFVASGIAVQIEHDNPKYIAGKSGIELANDVLEQVGYEPEKIQNKWSAQDENTDYWCGWALIQYQSYSGNTFKKIHRMINYENLRNMYQKYHEMDITKFYDYVDEVEKKSEAPLKTQRRLAGMSQQILATKSGTNLRTLQAYEQMAKDIKKAGIETVKSLADTIGCNVEDII